MSLAVLDSRPIRWRWWALRRCSGPRIGRDAEHQQRYADQHDQAERDRGLQQDHRDDDERDDRAGEAGGDVHHLADVGEVVGADRDDLAGRDLARQGAAEAGRLAGDELDDAVRRDQPVGDREPVPHDAGGRLHQADRRTARRPTRAAARGPWRRRRRRSRGRSRPASRPGRSSRRCRRTCPPARVGHCPRAIHHRKPPGVRGLRRTGVVEGELAHPPTLRTKTLRQRIVFAVTAVTRPGDGVEVAAGGLGEVDRVLRARGCSSAA